MKATDKNPSSISISGIKLQNFLNFKNIDLQTTSGINLIIGENDTGKTGLLKIMYAISKTWEIFSRKEYFEKVPFKKVLGEKIFDVFQPRENRRIGDLVTKQSKEKLSANAKFEISEGQNQSIFFHFGETTYKTINDCVDDVISAGLDFNALFIPAKEVLTAFKTIKYARERLYLPGFDDTYLDLIKSLEVPISLRDNVKTDITIENQMEGLFEGSIKTLAGEEPFFYQKKNNKYSISVTSEGIKKVGMLTSLLSNRQLRSGSILFMDEPESNLHPKAVNALIDFIFTISRNGVQVFLASHSYFVLRRLASCAEKFNTSIFCHSLEKEKNGYISAIVSDLKDGIPDNPITREIGRLFDKL